MGRSLWFTLVTLVGAGIILATGHFFYPIQEWLFWRYFGYWAACLVWAYACTGFGYVALRKIVRVQMPALELLTCAFALGMASFAISMCLAGFLQLYKTALFFALPLLFLAIGGRPLTAFLHRRLAFGKGSLLAGARLSWSQVGLLGFGVFGLLLIYIGVVTPETVQFDARWKHLALAEDFVAYGGIHRFPEGWVFATRPHLASWLYVWAFLSSDLLFDKIVLSQHLEFTVFLFTAWIAVPALVRRLVPDANPSLVWVARFLYPGVWLYDSSLSAGADHIGAALAIPMLLLGWRAWRRLDPRYVLLLSLVMASAFMVKETLAAMLVPLPALAVAIRIVQFTIAKARGRLAADVHRKWWTVPFVAIAAVLVWSAPHWARNLVWYGDPLYPILFRHFDSRPWLPDSDYSYVWGYLSVQMDEPPGGWQGLWQAIKVVFTFPLLT